MPNLRKFSARDFVADIPSKWWNFVANFFNTVTSNSLHFAFTKTGEGCEVSTVGYTGVFWAQGQSHSFSTLNGFVVDQYRYNVESGRITTAPLNQGMTGAETAASLVGDIPLNFTGPIRTRIEYFASVTTRFRITTDSGGNYLDFTGSGTYSYFIDLPAGADIIRYQIDSALSGSWSLVTYYEEIP
jgi:hypothetical protein